MKAAPSPERGVTLIETLLAVVILGIAFVVILGGMGTGVIGSDYHRKQATGEVVLRSYAEAILAETYVSCPSTPSYSGAGYTPPAGYSVSVTTYEYWNATTNVFQSTCPATDGKLQRLTLQAKSNDNRAIETTQVAKRKP